jgi:hypothetical protein
MGSVKIPLNSSHSHKRHNSHLNSSMGTRYNSPILQGREVDFNEREKKSKVYSFKISSSIIVTYLICLCRYRDYSRHGEEND